MQLDYLMARARRAAALVLALAAATVLGALDHAAATASPLTGGGAARARSDRPRHHAHGKIFVDARSAVRLHDDKLMGAVRRGGPGVDKVLSQCTSSFPWLPLQRAGADRAAEVRASLKSSAAVAIARGREPPQGTLVSLHLRKTGGTTVRLLLADLQERYARGEAVDGYGWRHDHVEYRSMDHVKLLNATLRPRALYSTILREPLSRWNSSYFFESRWVPWASVKTRSNALPWRRWLEQALRSAHSVPLNVALRRTPRLAALSANASALWPAEAEARAAPSRRLVKGYARYRKDGGVPADVLSGAAGADAWEGLAEYVKMGIARNALQRECPAYRRAERAGRVPHEGEVGACCRSLRAQKMASLARYAAVGSLEEEGGGRPRVGVNTNATASHAPGPLYLRLRLYRWRSEIHEWYTNQLSGRLLVEDLARCPVTDEDELLAKCTLAAHDLVGITEWMGSGGDAVVYLLRALGCPDCELVPYRWEAISASHPPVLPSEQMPADVREALAALSARDARVYAFARELVQLRVAAALHGGDTGALVLEGRVPPPQQQESARRSSSRTGRTQDLAGLVIGTRKPENKPENHIQ